ncbi:MAG: ATP-binding protein [Kiloniellales bacterium]|nr:ATP-binding protein [Kiloniellales bacterium]
MFGQDSAVAIGAEGRSRLSLRLPRLLQIAVVLALCAAACWGAYVWSERLFLRDTQEQARASLELYAQSLQGALRKHEVIPKLLAGRLEVVELFRRADDPEAVARANRLTKQVNETVGAEDTYFMDAQGLTFAASNAGNETTFVGRNFDYRPYFQEAIQGRLGRYFALGTTSNKRGYYFAYPVWSGSEILGAVVVKMNIDRIESAWTAGPNEVLVSDPNGVIFVASRPAWRFRTIGKLSEPAIAEITSNRQYDLAALSPLDLEWWRAASLPFDLVRVRTAEASAVSATSEEFLVESALIEEAGWTIHVLADTGPAQAWALTTLAITVLACLLAHLVFAVVMQRRRRLIERIDIQRAAAERLEQRVRERTADLSASNLRLEEEITERKAAEAELRQTQNELIQAGKLAALGQMSAAISHEFNQPLAAIRSYAENAGTLIERGRHDEAHDNCGRIRDLTGRMAEISKHLNAFARKPRSELTSVSLAAVIDDTLDFLRGRLQAADALVRLDKPEAAPVVRAGPVRLQQVITNLILNALDAARDGSKPTIEIALAVADERVRLEVRDYGTGIAEADLARIFDPFFTTKEVGHGLGLGLSISYNIVKDFDGTLHAENHPDGGARFTVELPLEANAANA